MQMATDGRTMRTKTSVFAKCGSIRATATISLALSVAGCALLPSSDAVFTDCGDLLPGAIGADIFGDSELVRVTEAAEAPGYPYVNEMVTDGLACGLGDDTVLIGQLAMDEAGWTSVQEKLIADGAQQLDEEEGSPTFVLVPKAGSDQPADAGFTWEDGILYYASTAFFFLIAPVFTQ